MNYKEIINLKLDNIINNLEVLKSSGLNKKNVLLTKQHSDLLLEISKQEESNLNNLLTSIKDLYEFLSLIKKNSIKDIICDINDENLNTKYNTLLTLENEVKKINELNCELVTQCSNINTYYLNLLYPQEDNGYNMDNSLINKKLKKYL